MLTFKCPNKAGMSSQRWLKTTRSPHKDNNASGHMHTMRDSRAVKVVSVTTNDAKICVCVCVCVDTYRYSRTSSHRNLNPELQDTASEVVFVPLRCPRRYAGSWLVQYWFQICLIKIHSEQQFPAAIHWEAWMLFSVVWIVNIDTVILLTDL